MAQVQQNHVSGPIGGGAMAAPPPPATAGAMEAPPPANAGAMTAPPPATAGTMTTPAATDGTVTAAPPTPATGEDTVAPPANGVAAGNQFGTTSLYVGDLDVNVTDSVLYDHFSHIGQVISVRVCKDMTTRHSLGYGYVNYGNADDANRAIQMLNFTLLNGKSIRVMLSCRDPTLRRSGAGNVFIKNLDKTIDNKQLHDTFSTFGTIISCKVASDHYGFSRGYGFVQFSNEESSKIAIAKLNGMLLNDKPVYVGNFVRKQERETLLDSNKYNNVYVKNLAESITEEELKDIFGEYGAITSVVVMKDADGKSKCFGFVNFENPDNASNCVEGLNGKTFDDKEWYVGRAQKKSDRAVELKSKFEQTAKEIVDKSQGLNLYIKNLDDSIDDDKFKDLFSEFGTITSFKVMRDPNGISRGSGFVAFSTAEESSRALLVMNGKMVVSKPLYVAIAQRKEDRQAKLQAQFSQMRPMTMPPSMSPRMPMYSPGIGQQFIYGQPPPPTMIPSQAGFGYQQQLVPGMRPPGGAAMPNFIYPFIQQAGQYNQQRPGGRRGGGGGPMQQPQSVPLMQQQQMLMPRGGGGRVYRYPPGTRNIVNDAPVSGGGIVPIPVPVSYDNGAGLAQPVPVTALISSLANATPEQQRMMLGENLFPLVHKLENENAAKVTGMLLEMDQTEVLHLLESPEALKAKVSEALDVLRKVQQQQQVSSPTSQMASMSLSDSIVA
ncbi:polyadenylate-binding protein 2-like [Impatiens glandulifera]|uniref:polyadenylate-binding protein 2-like n=1 Tax=Impatiens glandulifera TaxID=253017 RepID=UPI001FB06168|nr:polyadenylate-binding protein 2-like [Impatiens glandulifera]